MAEGVCLRGQPLLVQTLLGLAGQPGVVWAEDLALQRMACAYGVVQQAIAEGQAIYGVSRGVGALKTQGFALEQQAAMAEGMVQAHTAAFGAPYPVAIVRLAVVLKLNTLLAGRSGASPALAEFLARLLSAGITPEIAQEGSIGCSDILPNGQLAAALGGQGFGWQGFGGQAGERLPMARLLAQNHLVPYLWQGKDVIAMLSHNSLTVAHALISARAARQMLDRLLLAISLAAIGLKASPQAWRVAAQMARGGVAQIGAWLAALAVQQPWPQEETIHDPLELRFIPQIFGPVYERLTALCEEIEGLSAQSDENPIVLDGVIVTSGGSHLLGLALHLESLRSALAHAIRNGFNHAVMLTNGRRAGLMPNLVVPGTVMTGFGPFLKLCGATVIEAIAGCDPVAILPLALADGLEDEALHHSLSLQRLDRQIQLGNRMAAALAILGAQATDLNGLARTLPPAPAALAATVRRHLPFAPQDLPLAGIVEALMESMEQQASDWGGHVAGLPARNLA